MRTRQALRLQELALFFELLEPLPQLHLDAADGALDDVVPRDVVGGRVDRHVLHLLAHLAGEDVERDDALDGVAEHLDPERLFLVGRMDLDRVAPGPEGAAHEVDVVAGVLQVDEATQDLALVAPLSHREPEDAVPVLVG